MRIIPAILTLIFLLVPFAHGSMLTVDKIQGEHALLPYISWLADPDGKYDIDDMTQPDVQVEFKPLGHGVPLAAKGPVWLRLTLRKSAPETGGLRAGDARLAMSLGELPPGTSELYLFERGGPVAGVSGWIKEPLASHSFTALPDPGLTPTDVYIRMDNPPGLWFAPTVCPQEQLSPSILPPDLLLPGLLLLGIAVCLLRAAGDRAAWAFWASLFLACVLAQSLLPLPGEQTGFALRDLPALLAPGMAMLLLPQVGRCMFAAGHISALSSGILFIFSLFGAALCLAPLVPGLGWISRLFPLWPLLLAPLLPMCLGFLAARRPGSLAFSGICFLAVIGTGVALFAVIQPNLHPLAPQAGLWGLAVGGLGFALARVPKAAPASEEADDSLDAFSADQAREANPGMTLALSAVEQAKADGSLKIADSALFSQKSQYDELPELAVSRLDPGEAATSPVAEETVQSTSAVPDLFAGGTADGKKTALEINAFRPQTDSSGTTEPVPASRTAAPLLEEAFSMPVAADKETGTQQSFGGQNAGTAAAEYATPKLFIIPDDLPEDENASAIEEQAGTDEIAQAVRPQAEEPAQESAPETAGEAIPEDKTAAEAREESSRHGAAEETPAPEEQLVSLFVSAEPATAEPSVPDVAGGLEGGSPPLASLQATPGQDYAPPRLFVIPDTGAGSALEPDGAGAVTAKTSEAAAEDEWVEPITATEAAAGHGRAKAMVDAPGSPAHSKVISLLDDNDFSGYSGYSQATPGTPEDEYSSALMEELREGASRQSSLPSAPGASSFVFDLGALAREIHESVVPLAKHKGLIFSWYADPSLPALLEGDSPSLRQALTLLLQSAVQVTGKGTVQLAIRRAVEPASSPSGLQYLLFTIKDSGAAQRTDAGFFHAWELASRTGGSFAADYSPSHGTEITFSVGFMLPSEEMAGRHRDMLDQQQQESPAKETAVLSTQAAFLQGQIDAHTLEERAEAEGIRIPASPAESAAAAPPATNGFTPKEPLPAPGETLPAPSGWHDPEVARILVTDMTTSNRRLLVNYLSEVPHEHVEVPSTADLPGILRDAPASLVIFDADMPEGELIETISILREQEKLHNHSAIPLLVLVSHDAQHERMMRAGASAVLHKPFSKQALEQEARKWLGLEPAQAENSTEDAAPKDELELLSHDSYAQALLSGNTGYKRESGPEARTLVVPARARTSKDSAEEADAAAAADIPAMGHAEAPGTDAMDVPVVTEAMDLMDAADAITDALMNGQEPAAMAERSEKPPASVVNADDTVDILAAALRHAELPPAGAVREVNLPPTNTPERDTPEGGAHRQAAPMLLGLSPEDVMPPDAGDMVSQAVDGDISRDAADAAPPPEEQPSPLLDLAIFGDEEAAASEPAGPHQKDAAPVAGVTPGKPMLVGKPTQRKIKVSVKRGPNAKAEETETSGPAPERAVADDTMAPAALSNELYAGIPSAQEAAGTNAGQPGSDVVETPVDVMETSAFEQDAGIAFTPPQTKGKDNAQYSAFDRDAGAGKNTASQEEPLDSVPESQMLVPLPGIPGEAVELVSLPLLPGVIHALRDALEDAFQGKEQAQTLLIQEATSRLAGKAEIFHLDKLSKISRCVERAAEADDLEAAVTLLDDLSVVTLRYINSLEECYQDFLNLNR